MKDILINVEMCTSLLRRNRYNVFHGSFYTCVFKFDMLLEIQKHASVCDSPTGVHCVGIR